MECLAERLKQQNLKTTITLREYLGVLKDAGSFVIPDYQRGYVWGQKKKDAPVDSVSYLIHSLKEAYSEKKDVFLQGITVHEEKESYDIVLVDGQQRTTFFYLLLKYLGYEGYLKIKYDIREDSNVFLLNLDVSNSLRDDEEKFQDIFFFKRTLRIFQRELKDFTKEDFLHFILDHVRFLFVIIPENQAKLVFTMMNGNKAIMTDEELIKAELLRCASLQDNRIAEAEHSELRGRLAREWDLWLYWWNDKKVQDFFHTDGRQLGWLLPLLMQKNSKVSFSEFREKLLKNPDRKQSKAVFKKMRLLQKSIEDKYNDSRSYNYLGVILYIRNSAELRYSFLRWFFTIHNEETHTKSDAELKRYFDWCIIGVNHEDIVGNNYKKYSDARSQFLNKLKSNLLFQHHYETAYRWLIRQNIKQDNLHNGRKFNFEIERNRSLEHVYPKSKIGHKSEEGVALDWDDKPLDDSKIIEIKLWREEMKWDCEEDHHKYYGSEHCIGNLVLLYKRDNSKFNDADFEKKNEYFFTELDDNAFKSRHLIHTTMVFSDVKWKNWNKEQVSRRKQKEISEFINEYPEKTNE